jgi:hypothetical protein
MNLELLVCVCVILLMFTLGVRMRQDPGMRSSFFRYKTKSSIRTEETWVYANLFAGRCVMISSVFAIIILILSQRFLLMHPTRMFMLVSILLIVVLLITVLLTERKMKTIFFKDGKRKPNSY